MIPLGERNLNFLTNLLVQIISNWTKMKTRLITF